MTCPQANGLLRLVMSRWVYNTSVGHGDLSSLNVLIRANGRAYIADVGGGRKTRNSTESFHENRGPIAKASGEIIGVANQPFFSSHGPQRSTTLLIILAMLSRTFRYSSRKHCAGGALVLVPDRRDLYDLFFYFLL
ncbi:hypothetical protein PAXINDRAFT_102148 [Paxillus involutus ATCC 200175]|uniref:Uncharacterized protein n=1 Tax=Paxillus involutus ATCC 200175 TaxID=664439 RepID=A0A0C9SQT3_PAXIN|nr:hypothetical protein PAXINDRAFT_102148 [Paxillus involutus ATCC 200175]